LQDAVDGFGFSLDQDGFAHQPDPVAVICVARWMNRSQGLDGNAREAMPSVDGDFSNGMSQPVREDHILFVARDQGAQGPPHRLPLFFDPFIMLYVVGRGRHLGTGRQRLRCEMEGGLSEDGVDHLFRWKNEAELKGNLGCRVQTHRHQQKVAVRADRQVVGHDEDRNGDLSPVFQLVAEPDRFQSSQKIGKVSLHQLAENRLFSHGPIHGRNHPGELGSFHRKKRSGRNVPDQIVFET